MEHGWNTDFEPRKHGEEEFEIGDLKFEKRMIDAFDSSYFLPVVSVGPGESQVSALNLLTKSATVIAR